jgi:hypothetical protein
MQITICSIHISRTTYVNLLPSHDRHVTKHWSHDRHVTLKILPCGFEVALVVVRLIVGAALILEERVVFVV